MNKKKLNKTIILIIDRQYVKVVVAFIILNSSQFCFLYQTFFPFNMSFKHLNTLINFGTIFSGSMHSLTQV